MKFTLYFVVHLALWLSSSIDNPVTLCNPNPFCFLEHTLTEILNLVEQNTTPLKLYNNAGGVADGGVATGGVATGGVATGGVATGSFSRSMDLINVLAATTFPAGTKTIDARCLGAEYGDRTMWWDTKENVGEEEEAAAAWSGLTTMASEIGLTVD